MLRNRKVGTISFIYYTPNMDTLEKLIVAAYDDVITTQDVAELKDCNIG